VSRFLARLLLSVALLAAWQGALVHPLVHVDEQGGFVHLADGHGHDKKSNASELCDAIGALAAVVASAPKAVAADVSSQVVLSGPAGAPRAAEAPPFLSQGPPQLL
jgi:hypothetical protein